jgi:hypothetical protein
VLWVAAWAADVAVTGFPVEVFAPLGASGLVALAVYMIFTGRLVSGKERDYWRDAFFEEQRQKRELMETGRVARDVLRALPETDQEERRP